MGLEKKNYLEKKSFKSTFFKYPFYTPTIMADKEVLFAIKQQIMSVDDLIKEREDKKIQVAAKEASEVAFFTAFVDELIKEKEAMKIQLADKEVSDKESQTDLVPK